jgi:hypothetical protein
MDNISIKYENSCSGLAFDWTESQKTTLAKFFDLPNIKINFALKYVELDKDKNIPNWIEEIIKFLN